MRNVHSHVEHAVHLLLGPWPKFPSWTAVVGYPHYPLNAAIFQQLSKRKLTCTENYKKLPFPSLNSQSYPFVQKMPPNVWVLPFARNKILNSGPLGSRGWGFRKNYVPFEVNYQFHSLADLGLLSCIKPFPPKFASHLEKTSLKTDLGMPLCAPFLYKEGREATWLMKS